MTFFFWLCVSFVVADWILAGWATARAFKNAERALVARIDAARRVS